MDGISTWAEKFVKLHCTTPYEIIDCNDVNAYNASMASMTIRNLDDTIKRQLRIRAAENGHSLEEEARQVLERSVRERSPGNRGLGSLIHRRFKAIGGVDLELPPRGPGRELPDFSSDGQ